MTVGSEDAQVLCTEVIYLLEKGAIEFVPPAQRESGYNSRYFLVPKKDGGLRPILDLRLLNYSLMKRSFRMITSKKILSQKLVAGSEKHVLSHPGSPPSQTILEIRIRKGDISIQGPAVWAVPGSPHFYTMHGSGSLPSATDGNPHTQLPERLAHSGPVAGGFDIAQDPPLQPIRLPGPQGQLCQKHTVTQTASFIPGHSYRADDSICLSGVSHDNSAPRHFLQGRYHPSTRSFPENAGPYVSGFAGTTVGSAAHVTHPVLAEAEGSIRGLASWTPPRNGDLGLCTSPGPLEGPLLAKARGDLRHSTQKEDCHDRLFQQGLGSAVRGQTDLRYLVRRGVGPALQLPRNASSVQGLSILPAGHTGTPCCSMLRKQGLGVIHKSLGRPHREATLANAACWQTTFLCGLRTQIALLTSGVSLFVRGAPVMLFMITQMCIMTWV